MKLAILTLVSLSSIVLAQERCDAPYPTVYCNTTEILAYESSDCRPYHVFIARGSDEPYPGRQGNITKEICAAIGSDDCGFENIQYPAKSTAWGVDEWCKSAAQGAKNGQAQMTAYAAKCPDSKLILLGYSQGASVAQDILGGGGGAIFSCEQAVNPALDRSTAPGSNIVAAVTFGAVARARNQNFTIGDGKPYDGRRARTTEQIAALRKFAGVFVEYCHYSDPMCAPASLPQDVMVHLNYFVEHNEEAVKWVVDMAKRGVNDAVASSTSTKSAKSTSSAKSSASTSASASASASTTGSSKAQTAQSGTATTTDSTLSKYPAP
ncbi:carbohydrate esterase family 5 protein [Dothidotthia symphoricarpi CBS 119687]|uniref:Carbohydrate esterase family 5 protein n=1 Tax=Dothidotthia symphoricarpi CBS 119687 TaxID=1392245 RepID=A0A6A5ZWX5_9PLEO|nr:carbohydrate esterase family 5 protein [Dothidotthia symphoricarpi CBS 119687]KAF2124080.1 carbohydrate esterase family 5 protein [Dothidotthia symphoricarpi CBS 119687]